jgi:branched-chain amino acid transport system substrate-binding protein
MKIKVILFVLVLVLGLAVGNPQFVVRAESDEGTTLHFGAILPLSGPAAHYGKRIQDGIELAVSDLRMRDTKVRVSYEDVAKPGAEAVSAIRNLVEAKKIDALVGNFWNPVIPIIAATVRNAKLLTFHTSEADDFTTRSGEFVFSTNATIHSEAEKMAAFAYHTLSARRASIIYVGTTFGEQYNKHFSKAFVALGGSILSSDLVALGENDVRTVLTRTAMGKPDVYVTGSFGSNLGTILKGMRELKITTPVISTYETEDPSVLAAAGSIQSEQLHYFSPEGDPAVDGVRIFNDRFFQRFGYLPTVHSTNAYDATIIAAEAFASCKADRICAGRYVTQVKNFAGVSGTITINEHRTAQKNFVLKVFKDGKFQRVR